jgi:pectinesterase inhibitor-like protein
MPSLQLVIDIILAKAPSSIEFISKGVTKVDPEIKNICNEGGDKTTRCIETLSKLFQGPFDVVKALEIEVNATLGTAKAIFDNINTLLNDSSTDKGAIDALNICREEYDSMLDSIKSALESVLQKHFADAYSQMSAVISYKSACQLGWDESPGVQKPYDETTLIESTVICVDILYYIVNSHKF